MRKDSEYYFAIVLKESGKVIGEIFAHPEGNDHPGSNCDTFSPCWMLNSKYHGKGYAYEAAQAYFDFLFNDSLSKTRKNKKYKLTRIYPINT